ncbi:MAG: hypothetical protein GX185_01380 [Tissierellia bacterium]|nr:hypothetical protein [Tissierellia bacterium]
MENKNTISKLIDHTRKIEENNNINIKYSSSISSLINSDLEQLIDRDLEEKLQELNKRIKDINQLTAELLEDLSKRHN